MFEPGIIEDGAIKDENRLIEIIKKLNDPII
jgi:hypothetical protein